MILDPPPEGPSGADARREIVVDVPIADGAYEFAIGVEDVASGSASYLRRRLVEALNK